MQYPPAVDIDTRAAAYCVLVEDGRVLLTHWARGQRWTLPGGGMELGEDTERTAVRECHEETGLEVRIDRLLGVDTNYVAAADRLSGPNRPMRGVRVIYAATVVGGVLRGEQDGSSDDAAWFAVTALPVRVDLVDTALRLWRAVTD